MPFAIYMPDFPQALQQLKFVIFNRHFLKDLARKMENPLQKDWTLYKFKKWAQLDGGNR